MMKIPLVGRQSMNLFALCSNEDYEELMKYNWLLATNGKRKCYAYSNINGKRIYMHRFIMNPPDDMVVDHLDGDGLDNRRENLKICTAQENNTRKTKSRIRIQRGSSRYLGVSFNKSRNNWVVYIKSKFHKRRVFLGSYEDEEKAGMMYDLASITWNNNDYCLNFPNKFDYYRADALHELKTASGKTILDMMKNV